LVYRDRQPCTYKKGEGKAAGKPCIDTQPNGFSFQWLAQQQFNELGAVININGGKNNADQRNNDEDDIQKAQQSL
jgi:hypothetical protein